MQTHDIIVIGASAGGLDPLKKIVNALPSDFSATIFISKHIPDWVTADILLKTLEKGTKLHCKLAVDGEEFQKSTIYIAPPDFHLLLDKNNKIILQKGARENSFRPAIDPLFRSAAAFYGSRVVGIILAGLLSDGSAGLFAIKRCGGVAIVQTPEDALYPEMPQNALDQVEVDFNLNASDIASVLQDLSFSPVKNNIIIPIDIIREAEIASTVQIDIDSMDNLGQLTPFSCPDCGGSLWEINNSTGHRFRCQTGHSFTLDVLLKEQAAAIEQTLWVSLRFFEERKTLLQKMQKEAESLSSNYMLANSIGKKISEIQIHINRIRNIIITDITSDVNEPSSQILKPPTTGVSGAS